MAEGPSGEIAMTGTPLRSVAFIFSSRTSRSTQYAHQKPRKKKTTAGAPRRSEAETIFPPASGSEKARGAALSVSAANTSKNDERVKAGRSYWYRVAAVGPGGAVEAAGAAHGHPTAQWLNTVDLTASSFTQGTPDASFFDFPILAPSASVNLPFDLVGHAGLFAFTCDSTATPGSVNTGSFAVHAALWNGDPLAGGTFAADAGIVTAAYSTSIASPTAGL